MWQKRGHPVRVPAAGANRKFVVFGALDYATGQGPWQLSRRKASEAFGSFLDQLRHAWPDEKLGVVLDNVGYHKGRQTSNWWRQWHHQIGPFFLPAYSPELNLMERVWRHVKDKLSCPRWWADWQALWEATTALLTHLTARFHQMTRPGIEVVQNFCSSA
jgi:transposase